jgi:porin
MRPFAALLPNPKRCMFTKGLCLFVTDHYPAALPLNRFTACDILKRSNCTPKTPKKD